MLSGNANSAFEILATGASNGVFGESSVARTNHHASYSRMNADFVGIEKMIFKPDRIPLEELKQRAFVPIVRKSVKDAKFRETNIKTGEFSISTYRNQLREGHSRSYRANGRLKYIEMYNKGYLIFREYYVLEPVMKKRDMPRTTSIFRPDHHSRRSILCQRDLISTINKTVTYSLYYSEGLPRLLVNLSENERIEIESDHFNGEFKLSCASGYFEGTFSSQKRMELSYENYRAFYSDDVNCLDLDFFSPWEITPYANGFLFITMKRDHAHMIDGKGITEYLNDKEMRVIRYFEHGTELPYTEYLDRVISILIEFLIPDLSREIGNLL